MKRLIVLLLTVALAVSLIGCATPQAPAESSAPPAETQAPAVSESKAPAETEAPAETSETTFKYAEEAAKAAAAYTSDTYYDNYENYKDFGADGKYKVAFVCKFITSSWFAPKTEGMKEQAEKLGVEFIGIDGNNAEDQFLQGVQNAINQDVDAIILTPVSAAMVPSVIDLCKEAGVAYITTDDGGYDSDGNRVPHLGLDDFGLCYASAKAAGAAAVERGFDVSSLKIALLDAPAVESIRARSMGIYQGLIDSIPGLTDDNFIWLDTIDNLTDNNIAKLSAAFQANAAAAKYWIVGCGGNNVWDAMFPVFDENGVDYANVLGTGVAGDGTIVDSVKGNDAKAATLFCSGILPAPSGRALIDLCYDLFKNGTKFPNFSGYPEIIVSADTLDDWAENFK
jgi:ABC-type sugar transport system substrate-binding protein